MQEKLKNYITPRNVIAVVAVLVIIYGAYSTLKVIGYNYKLQQQIDTLEKQVELLDLQNKQLEYNNAYYQTNEYADKAARDKLNLQAPGENVVIFPDKIPRGLEVPKTPEQIADEQSFSQRSKSNFKQWMYFLFKKQPNS